MNLTSSQKASEPKLPIRCWKALYMKLTSVKVRYQNSDIEAELSECGKHFEKGIFQFCSNVPQNYIELRDNKTTSFMESFYQRLSKILHVDIDSSKEIFANYLLYNCNNSGTLLQERLEKNIRAVLLSAWSFYAQERVFFLKCYSHIISASMDECAPYSSVFRNFLSKMSPRERHTSLLTQYHNLIHLELPSANTFGSLADMLVPLWITYNLREQLEMLLLIILMTSQIELSLNDIDKLIELLQITSFGRYQCFFYHHSHLTTNQQALQEQIHYAITLYSIQVLSTGWKEDIYKDESNKFTLHNKIMYPADYDMKRGPIVISWILVLFHRLMNSSSYDEQLSNQSFSLLNEDLWKVLADALESSIMDTNGISDVLEPHIDDMVHLMFTKFGTCAFKSQLTLASIVSFFCKFHFGVLNQSSTAIVAHFQERFPLNCAATFKMLGAILAQRKEIIDSLSRLPFSVKKDDCVLRTVELNKYVLEHNITPLKFFPNNVILRGTPAIPDFEDNIVTLKKSLPIWDIMRNFLTMYLNGYDDADLIITIIEIVNFVEIWLQKIRTIDNDILKFSELVVQVIWKTSSSCNSLNEMNLLAACIKLQGVLFCIMPEDIIKCFEIYNFLPGYPVRMRRRDIHLYDTYYTESRIYTIVCCKEAKAGLYSVLSSYLNFFHKVVQNMLESWYTVAGLKFVLHIYNNVNNDFWKFKNLDDRNLIIWNCIEIIHEILNHGLNDLFSKKSPEELIDFRDNEHEHVLPTTYFITKSCVSSILNSVNESTVLSTAITGDIGLLESVIENACWTKGKSAIMINIIRYSLSLVQRCLIFVDVEKKLKKTEISFDHLFQPDKCLALLSYRYNCFSDTICLLAIKLLIKLALIKENCMFSWLQYSNELLQKEFLYPLYSNNESNAVKSSLLALMAVCIMKQIVIADALLEIDKVRKICVEKRTPDKKWQNLLSFTSRYICDVDKKKDAYMSNMHCAVLNVIYACWEKKLRVPQQYYKMSSEFWKFLFAPFRENPKESFKGYGFVLETICLEIIDSKTIDSNLESELKTFLNSEYFPKWTEFCGNVIDKPAELSVEFETISLSISTVADSWKKFIQVVTRHCNDLIENPATAAFPIYETLVDELASAEGSNKEKFLCDIYRIYLTTWKSECSQTNWKDELLLMSKMFIVMNEYHFRYNPYFYSALLEIGYKILKLGDEHIDVLNELNDKSDFLLSCGEILNHKLANFSKLIYDKNETCVEYPPLLVHLCIFTRIINGIDVSSETMMFILRETDFVNFTLKTANDVLKTNGGTKTGKMLIQFQNFVFEKYPFLKKNYFSNESVLSIFQSIFPSELPNDEHTLLNTFSDKEKNNLFRFGLNFLSNLTNEPTCESKALLVEFNSKNKQYLFTILRMVNVTLKKNDLYLITAVVTFYFRISQHLFYCKYSEINDLVESMFLLFNCVKSAVSMLIQPSKMCSLLLNVPLHHLSQFFEDSDNVKNISVEINETYEKLIYLVKIGIQTLSAFCIHIDNTLCGTWPPEDWNFRWLNKVKSKAECSFPLLLLDLDNAHDDFTTLAAYVTLEHRAYTKRMKIESPSSTNLVGNKLMILNYDKSGETLLDLSDFLFSQAAMYLLHPLVDHSKKLFFVNHIFVNLKEFIKNALNDSLSEEITLPVAIEDYDTFKKRKRSDSEMETETVEDDKSENKTLDVTPIPARQVLNLRGNDVKNSKSMVIGSKTVEESKLEDENRERLQTLALQTVAALFYKLITTFKHS